MDKFVAGSEQSCKKSQQAAFRAGGDDHLFGGRRVTFEPVARGEDFAKRR
jgi:hypothetical protein